MQETWVWSLGWEDPLEKEVAPHSSTLAWKIPWMRSLVGYSPWGYKESDMTERLHYAHSATDQTPGLLNSNHGINEIIYLLTLALG